ncbi:copper chaperone PCu(A)C [Rubellimicrobium sp. CFH 75288]|uniref:copper chaperone PCu(A)C n=1 Tax=Rubellimicrobium sp. CFH 75288 TaxID=2697034 RepID=UPI0014133BDC|nr:copper chaperone PCu(A)C [Rubellimicrobium sp. CFH 75288]NAZ36294.1 copper chaperone PCu(A)C [Rubellimicrobium sp. CFH 75288]
MSQRLALALAALLTAPAAWAGEGVEIHDAFAISAGPAAQSGAAFMVIHNHGGPDDRLVRAESPAAERVELHTHEIDADGVARMMEVEEGFPLPTDGELVLERGGHHVMFLGLTEPWEDGDLIPLTLVFEVAGEIELEVPVDRSRLAGGHGHEAGHGHGHGHSHGEGSGG